MHCVNVLVFEPIAGFDNSTTYVEYRKQFSVKMNVKIAAFTLHKKSKPCIVSRKLWPSMIWLGMDGDGDGDGRLRAVGFAF